MALFLGEEFGDILTVLVLVDDDVLGGWDKAVLDTAVAAKAFLVGAGVKEADIEWVVLL